MFNYIFNYNNLVIKFALGVDKLHTGSAGKGRGLGYRFRWKLIPNEKDR